ncbi:MAG: alpha/beta fold hydrolase [Bdellovibrionales bacterium]|nr:alpha/beta fold hydrolase [Bdellovibrionales bacterium]
MSRPAPDLKDKYPSAEPFYFEGSQTDIVLLIHGFTGTPAEMRPLASSIHEQMGWTCKGILLNGHGTNVKNLCSVDLKTWIQDIDNEISLLSKSHTNVHLVGLSMGALLCLEQVLRPKCDVKSVVLLAPAFILRGFAKWLMPVLAHTSLPKVPLLVPKTKLNQPDHIAYNSYDCHGVSQLAKLQSKIKKELRPIQTPTLLIYSSSDETVDPHSGDTIKMFLDNSLSRVIKLENSNHILTLASEKNRVFQETISFYRVI